ncbi:MAG: XdhC/CoxI family protein [Acidimicrobiales bacterium]
MRAIIFDEVRQALDANEPVAVATVISVDEEAAGEEESAARSLVSPDTVPGAALVVRPGTPTLGSLGDDELDRVVARDAFGALEAGRNFLRHYGPNGQAQQVMLTVFIESFAPPRRMIIIGATDFSAALVRVAKTLGYRVSVCDARPVFATPSRFPEADEVVAAWPHLYVESIAQELKSRDAVCVLSHDKKFDLPAITAALGTSVGYIGVMGSRRTISERFDQLRTEGVDESSLERLMAPIGLDIGARTPEETAVAIMAEMIAHTADLSVRSLRDQSGPIHRPVS